MPGVSSVMEEKPSKQRGGAERPPLYTDGIRRTQAQKTEAIRITRETDDVKYLVDRLTIEGRQ